MRLSSTLTILHLIIPQIFAATADQWRGRSLYQIITDRYALPQGSDLDACDPGKQDYCGGTWNTIRENLDYIHNAGFTAIWISPVNQNYDGPRTAYGYPYHGYWMADITQLNDKFGTSDDLHALVDALHERQMYIMVDIVVNNVMATSTTPDYSSYLFKDASYYHPYCPIQWGNTTSEQDCWMGDEKVPLPDLDTGKQEVIDTYNAWIAKFVQEYQIDGLRIDAAKHVDVSFWPKFCGSAGVFCMGEVFGDENVDPVAAYQGPNALDSVLNFPMYNALKDAFSIPGDLNISQVADVLEQSKAKFHDTTVLGNFLENQDVPRWHSHTVDPQAMYNAMTWTFMGDGIPIVYAGQEQYFSGSADPYNREPLWPSGYTATPAYTLISELNTIRNFLVAELNDTWTKAPTEILTQSPYGIAFQKDAVITILTNIGSPGRNGTNIAVQTGYPPETVFFDVTSGGFGDGKCRQWVTGSGGHIDVQYMNGGRPVVLVRGDALEKSSICDEEVKYAIIHKSELNSGMSTFKSSAWGVMIVIYLLSLHLTERW
ncbi:glycoside hydrolase family 13 protein [Mucidula mucida]|nr:glycoside hydrolase family 13 protein [Mucidula mucida]